MAEEVTALAERQAAGVVSTVSEDCAMLVMILPRKISCAWQAQAESTPQLNILDQILAMICSRQVHPASFRASKPEAVRFAFLEQKRLRNEWIFEMGGLPGNQ